MAAQVATSPGLHRNSRVAIRATLVGVGALLVRLFVVPAPRHVNAQGVVWLPDEAHVRAGTNGVITRVAVAEGRAVRSGDLLVETRQPALETEVAKLGWRVDELQAEADSELAGDRVKRQISQFAIAETRSEEHTSELQSLMRISYACFCL